MIDESTIIFGGSINAPPQARLAREIGRSKSTITRWRDDPMQIPLGDLQKLCRIRGLTDEELLHIIKGR